MKKPKLPAWCMVVREPVSRYEREVLQSPKLATSDDVAKLLQDRLGRQLTESMVAVVIDAQNHAMAMQEVARGGISGCSMTAREIFRLACAIGGSGVILAHNHPSGDPTPSPEDVAFTRAIAEAGEVLGIQLVDHVVIAGTRHVSMLNERLL